MTTTKLRLAALVCYILVMFASCAQLEKYKDGVIERTNNAVEYVDEVGVSNVDWTQIILYVLLGLGTLGGTGTSIQLVKKMREKKDGGIPK